MKFEYKTKGTCSQRILFEVEDGIVHNVEFIGGCNGNLQGISKLVEGMNIDEVIQRIEGIRCGMKPTSCPDQLATALMKAKKKL
ncbi:MAG: TIGR03905 family TSCPD domain-containing protein [Oscillospiraceae bacterium]|nr:TIGR03905 family TSCPD domain-containing protein [Oscillospiraceae bacterium]